MRKNLIFLLLCFCTCTNLKAQNTTAIIAPKYIVNGVVQTLPLFGTGSDPENGYHGAAATSSQNIQMAADGSILFFTVDNYVYGKKGEYIETLTGAGSYACKGISEIVVVPVPGDCQSFFLITVGGTTLAGSMAYDNVYYGKLHVEYDNLGNMVNTGMDESITGSTMLKDISVLAGAGYEELGHHGDCQFLGVTTLNTSTNTRLLFVNSNKRIFRYKISSTGVAYDSYYIDIDPANVSTISRGELEVVTLSNGNYRLAVGYQGTASTDKHYGVYISDFNSSGTQISGSIKRIKFPYNTNFTETQQAYIYGLEFSQNGGRLYVTHGVNTVGSLNPYALEMADVTAALTVLPTTVITGGNDFMYSQIEKMTDGSMIMVCANRMARITNANNPNLTTDWNNSYVAFTSPFTHTLSNAGMSSTDKAFKSYLLQDQLDNDNYTDNYYQNSTCCIYYNYYDKSSFSAVTNATWAAGSNPLTAGPGNEVYIKTELRIPKGKTITISNMIIHFGPGARLIIENGDGTLQGGKLTLTNGTILTSDGRCSNTMWQGVEVWGNSTVSQGSMGSSQQGRLQILGSESNFVIIQNAVCGASARATNATTGAVLAPNYGGMIQATSGRFINNQNDIMLLNYAVADNISWFSNCNFSTNNLFEYLTYTLGYHMTLTGVTGVSIKGCDFINSAPANFAVDKKGVGIYALNSNFIADRRCSGIFLPCVLDDGNVFTNLHMGILSISFWSTLTFKSDGNKFVNNNIGIAVSGGKNTSLVRNEFQVKKVLSTNPIVYQTAGISLTSCTGYQVEENSFTVFNDPSIASSLANSYGLVITSSGETNNRVYRNLFTDLRIGGQSEQINGSIQVGGNGTGLMWNCNRFNAPMHGYDMTVMDGRISYHQGYVISSGVASSRLAAANNKFSNDVNASFPEHDFFVSSASTTNNINYVDYNLQPNYRINEYTTSKIAVSHAVALGSYITFSDEGCPSNFTEGIVFMPLAGGNGEMESTSAENLVSKSQPNELVVTNDEAYLQRVADESRQMQMQNILFGEHSEISKNQLLEAFLVEQRDVESMQTLAEFQVHQRGAADRTLLSNPALSINFVELIKIKEKLVRESDLVGYLQNNIEPQMVTVLQSIAQNQEDLWAAGQAKIILSLTRPLDLTYHFIEVGEKNTSGDKMNYVSAENKILVLPNPVKDQLTISIDLTSGKLITTKVYSVLGSEIVKWNLSNTSKTFDVNYFEKGVYLIHMTDENGSLLGTVRFVKN